METKFSEVHGVRVALVLASFAYAGIAAAQQPRVAQELPDPSTQAGSCADVEWAPDMLEQYPRIREACQEVVTAAGERWARFEAEFVRRNIDGSVRLDFKDRDGRSIETLTLQPAEDQRVTIAGQTYRFGELQRGQELNLYVPEGIFAVGSEAGAPEEQMAQVVQEPVQVAQAEPEPQPQAAPRQLPRTAGPLPMLALAGIASLLGGLILTIRRRLRS